MKKNQIARINRELASRDEGWQAYGKYVILRRDPWVPCVLVAGGSTWDLRQYTPSCYLRPICAPFGSVNSMFSAPVDRPEIGGWVLQFEPLESLVDDLERVVRKKISEFMNLAPIGSFLENAEEYVHRKGLDKRGRDYRIEINLVGAGCVVGDLNAASLHLAFAREACQSSDDGYSTPPIWLEIMSEFDAAILSGVDAAFHLVERYRKEGCARIGIPVDLPTGE